MSIHTVVPADTIEHKDHDEVHDEIAFDQYFVRGGIFMTQVDYGAGGKPFDAVIHISMKQAERVRDLLTEAIERSKK